MPCFRTIYRFVYVLISVIEQIEISNWDRDLMSKTLTVNQYTLAFEEAENECDLEVNTVVCLSKS